MLNSFLRESYKSKAVPQKMLESHLKCWKISQSLMSKTFKFEDFKSAVSFVNLAGAYVKEYGINANISNVYNKVTVTIEEKAINNLTTREFKAAVYLNEIGSSNDIFEEIVNKDYYVGSSALPERYSLEINNMIPTDPFQPKKSFLIGHKNLEEQIKLI